MKGQAGMDASPEKQEQQDEISLVDLAASIWKGRWLIVIVTVLAAAFSIVYALLQDNVYTASSSVIPVTGETGSSLAQYAGLASMAGISLPGGGETSSAQKIEAILKSRSLSERLVSDLGLVSALLKDPEKVKAPRTPAGLALEAFMKDVYSVSADEKTGIIKVTVTTKDPGLSSEIANYAIVILEESLNAKALTVSKKSQKLLTTQVAEQEAKVKVLQEQLTTYQRKTNLITPEGQVEQAMTLYSTLIQQKISAEIELSRLESALSSDNPKIIALKTQLEAIERQIAAIQGTSSKGGSISLGDTPEAIVKYQNILQELEIATRIYGGLLASLEDQKLQENQDQLFVEVIDPAVAPEEKSAPSRAMICVVGTMAGGFLGILMVFLLEALKNIAQDPTVMAKFRNTSKAKAL
jgi:tyrosine-protein kinase Etk/Wzc